MKSELRFVNAAIATGFTEILLAALLHLFGLHIWWWEHMKMFGSLGIGMMMYGFWHSFYIQKDAVEDVVAMEKLIEEEHHGQNRRNRK